jgi:hypothetical protein
MDRLQGSVADRTAKTRRRPFDIFVKPLDG